MRLNGIEAEENIRNILSINKSEYNFLRSEFPQLSKLLDFEGTTGEYYLELGRKLNERKHNDSERLLNFINIIKPLATSVYGQENANILADTLLKSSLVSTAEHHSFLTQLLNPALNQAYLRSVLKNDACIVFSCATVNLDDSTQPRKINFKEEYLPILSNKYTKYMVLNSPAFNEDEFLTRLQEEYTKEEKSPDIDAIRNWWSCPFNSDVGAGKLWKQVSIFNNKYWQSALSEDLLRDMPSHYFMLPLEELARLAIIDELDKEKIGWLVSIFIDPEACLRLLNALDGVDACWNLKLNRGSFLFWRVEEKNRIPLALVGKYLQSHCGTVNICINKDSLQKELSNLNIIPTASLSIIYIALYLGINVLGGPFQINYLSKIQEILLLNFHHILEDEDLRILKNAYTNMYVNFNKTKPAVLDGLYRIHSKILKQQFADLMEEKFVEVMKGSIQRILSSK